LTEKIEFTLNHKPAALMTDPLRRLLDVLREECGLTGTKEGCGEGECGACSVLLDGRLTNSCLVPVGAVAGREVLTIEGYRESDRFAVMEEAFADAGAVQCGFCTPGMILAGEALLRRNPKPGDDEIREALSGNLCRCTGYTMIIEAVKKASERGDGLWE
jgi:aerobic carbon-monoxide dehydrogenase small subunit